MDEEDCYAEILKDDIIKLDDSSLASQEAHTRMQDPPQTLPFQGTAQRRIRLKVDKPRHPRLRFPTSKHSSNSTLFGTLKNRLVFSVFCFVLTLIALYLFLLGLGSFIEVKSCGRFGFGCKL